MELMIVSGTVAFVAGVAFLFFPNKLHQWSDLANRQLNQLDPTIRQHRVGAGLCLLAVGLFCFASTYYVWLRLH